MELLRRLFLGPRRKQASGCGDRTVGSSACSVRTCKSCEGTCGSSRGTRTSSTVPRDENVERVRDQLLARMRIGYAKYGTTTERTDIDFAGWLQHLQEELLDAAVYVERVKADFSTSPNKERQLYGYTKRTPPPRLDR